MNEPSAPEWSIRDVARVTGLTSRALRHYAQIGLLRPSRVAANGHRFYGPTELVRLYRIVSLRALGLPLTAIAGALADDTSLADAIAAHLVLLEERRDRTDRQIADVRRTLDAVREGVTMEIDEVFAGVDHGQYEAEVRERWGDDAWERSTARRARMGPAERARDDATSLAVNAALRAAAQSGVDPSSPAFQALVGDHHAWVSDQWAGRRPDAVSYAALADMYVADPRFAATYGGPENAEIIRRAIAVWVEVNLSATDPATPPAI